MKEELMKNDNYETFADDARASNEVLKSYKLNLIKDTPALGAISAKIQRKKEEAKVLYGVIMGGVMVVEKETGEQLSLDLKF